ncbi:50S ribosomal protein L10 [Candidatus Thorarchaeota archaeon]|nr:MAG: 50S ribosomal protein L10 [Candidatus Thorarchaeota archaeon]
MSVYEKEIPQWKIDAVKKLASNIDKSEMIGLVNVESVGAKQLQGIRDSLRGSAKIKMARNTLMIRAIEASKKKGIKQLEEYVQGPVAFVFSDEDPFVLSKFLSDNKAAAPAKGGQIAPKDIIIPEMNTGVAPGPFISELAGLKIPSRVRGGVIHITEDTVAVEAGEVISNAMAQMLSRLGLEPMELQLKLIAAYTDGDVLTAKTFEVDLEKLFKEVLLGHQYAVNLSINTGVPTVETAPLIIAKANMEAKSLTLNIGFFVPEMLNEFLAKANSESLALASAVAAKDPEAIPSEILSQAQAAAASAVAPQEAEAATTEEEPEEEEEEEEEEVAGMGSLFG